LGEFGPETLGQGAGEVSGAVAGVLLDEEAVLAERVEAKAGENAEGQKDEAGLAAERRRCADRVLPEAHNGMAAGD
jgi:hypothetical protein